MGNDHFSTEMELHGLRHKRPDGETRLTSSMLPPALPHPFFPEPRPIPLPYSHSA